MDKLLLTAVLAGFLFITSNSSFAVSLTSAGLYALPGTTVADRPELAGTVLEDKITSYSFIGNDGQTLSGNIQNRVIRSVDGTIDFSWRIFPTDGDSAITAFRVGGFDSFMLDADWRIDGLGDAAPDSARYFGDGTGNVNFIFDSTPVGRTGTGSLNTSRFFFLDTDAPDYDFTGSFDLLFAGSGCVSDVYTTWAPSTVVPVPGAVWLMASGLLGLIAAARRRA